MPENFTSLLEALNTEGRDLARPAPAGVIETLARGRRRRHRLTAATSALAVCAVAAGIAFGTGGGAQSRPTPITPATPTSTPSASASGTHQPALKNRVGADALLKASEAPQPAILQWRVTATHSERVAWNGFPGCDFGNSPQIHAQSEDSAEYTSSYDSSTATEVVYHYSSAAAAQKDYGLLKPDPAACKTAHVSATLPHGVAWSDGGTNSDASLHMMMVVSGTDIAYWFHQEQGNTPYDTSDDAAALQRMTDRLDGANPTPDPVTSPPANVLTGSAWLDVKQIPFATADQSHGWYQAFGQQSTPGAAPASNLCAAADNGIVDGTDATTATRLYHGTPANTPVYPGSNYLYSSAVQAIVSFPSADRAKAAFTYAQGVMAQHGCQFKDASGQQTTRTITAGASTGSGFSLLLTDKPGPMYKHVYVVLKGTHVATIMVDFEQGDTSTSGDAAILSTMAARLP